MKGIILAGGRGTRLYPVTKAVSKHLLPIYDKPLIYYPLSVLMLADIRDILIISTARDIDFYKSLLGDGSLFGISIDYDIQDSPRGIADAFIVGKSFIADDNVCLILGDNVFYGQHLTNLLQRAKDNLDGAVVFGYPVKEPSEFGVIEFDRDGKVLSIEEKPKIPKSKYAVPGLYFYSNDVTEVAEKIPPSPRGELEITDINNTYINQNRLKAVVMGRGMTWLDTGTPESLLSAGMFVETVQKRQGYYISCIEEIAWRKKYIDDDKLYELGSSQKSTEYGRYILNLLTEVNSRI